MVVRRRHIAEAMERGRIHSLSIEVEDVGGRRERTLLFFYFLFIVGDIMRNMKRKANKTVVWSFASSC